MTDAAGGRGSGTPAPSGRTDPAGLISEDVIVRTERRWFWVVSTVLAIIVVVIVVTGLTNNLHPPSNAQTIDPTRVYQSAEFSEANLGTAVAPDGSAIVRIIAQQYSFVPACVIVPVASSVTFRLTSADVIHGFIIAGSNVNSMVVPGYVSDVRGTFPSTGAYHMPCHEYCGIGHAGMQATVRVVPRDAIRSVSGTERLRCDEK